MVIRFLRVQQTFGFINAFPINISRYRHSPEFCRFRSIIKITSLTKPHPISEIRTSVVNDRSFESFITILVNSIFNRSSVNQEFLIIRSLVPLFGFSILINYKIIIYQINRRKSLRPTCHLLYQGILCLHIGNQFRGINIRNQSLHPRI